MNKKAISLGLVAILCGLIVFFFVVNNPIMGETSEYDATVIDDKHYEGTDLTSSRVNEEVYLADGDNITHTWDVSDIPNSDPKGRFEYPMVLNGGDLIYVDYSGKMARISVSSGDEESDLVWDTEFGHHDVAQYNDHLLSFNRSVTDSELFTKSVEDDLIYKVDPETGEKVGNPASIHEMMKNTELVNLEQMYEENLLQGRSEDILDEVFSYQGKNDSVRLYHANSIYVLNQDYDDTFREGRVLVSLRNLDTVILFDWEDKEIVWTSKGVNLDRQHHPTMTSDGNVMIYDNGEVNRNSTRIIEVSPNKTIEWSYTRDNFYSAYMGSAQELPNGNILITDSMNSSAFEITQNKSVVWRSSFNKEKDRTFRLTRFNTSCIEDVLEGDKMTSRMCQQHPYNN